ncbi:MAG: hypothetical protein ACFB21_08970 [Opitutales bacterium]
MKRLQSNIAVHIGWPKTATRSLRQSFFQVHPGLNAIVAPRGGEKPDPIASELIGGLQQSEQGWRQSRPRLEALLEERLSSERTNILAAEALAIGATPYNRSCADAATIAHRLHALMPNAQILMNVRAQFPVLKSTHIQLFAMMSPVSADFNRFIRAEHQAKVLSLLPYYQYDAAVERYRELFGADQVHVFIHETLSGEKQAYARRLAAILNLPETETLEHLNAKPRNRGEEKRVSPRILTKVFCYQCALKRPAEILRFLRPAPIDDATKTLIADYYRESNQRLASQLAVDLAPLGYAV